MFQAKYTKRNIVGNNPGSETNFTNTLHLKRKNKVRRELFDHDAKAINLKLKQEKKEKTLFLKQKKQASVVRLLNKKIEGRLVFQELFNYWQVLPNTLTHKDYALKTVKQFVENTKGILNGTLFPDNQYIPKKYIGKKYTVEEIKHFMSEFDKSIGDVELDTSSVVKTGIADFIYRKHLHNMKANLHNISPMLYGLENGYIINGFSHIPNAEPTFIKAFMQEAIRRAGEENTLKNKELVRMAANKAYSMLTKRIIEGECINRTEMVVVEHTGLELPRYVFDCLEKKFTGQDRLFTKFKLDWFWNSALIDHLKPIVSPGSMYFNT